MSKTLKAAKPKPAGAKRSARKAKLPGPIYLNKNRYWWKVKLPGETTITARPLVPVGARYATKDPVIAREVAVNLLQRALYSAESIDRSAGRSIMSIVQAFSAHARKYYRDVEEKVTSEIRRIEYATKPLVEMFAAQPVEEFEPLKLKEVRRYIIELKLAGKSANDRIATFNN